MLSSFPSSRTMRRNLSSLAIQSPILSTMPFVPQRSSSTRRPPLSGATLAAISVVTCIVFASFASGVISLNPRHRNLHTLPRRARTSNSPNAPENRRSLSPVEELAAVTSLLTAPGSNVLPLSVNPAVSIDPHLVLEFDIGCERATEELKVMREDVWTQHPVVLYGKSQSANTFKIKSTILALDIFPPPAFIDVDSRDDARVLAPLLKRLTHTTKLPILIIGGQVVESEGSSSLLDHLNALGKTSQLVDLLKRAGGVPRGARDDRNEGKEYFRNKSPIEYARAVDAKLRAQNKPARNRLHGPIQV
ncbi:hypothetical protein HGRIS_003000 [Hohenbuehelia grisea]|uniref:Uncharacterized protein n=1 Tax=Hohenbuehelia grisea TaxID=104357 RepID=A0ABR3JM61_9AGAR